MDMDVRICSLTERQKRIFFFFVEVMNAGTGCMFEFESCEGPLPIGGFVAAFG